MCAPRGTILPAASLWANSKLLIRFGSRIVGSIRDGSACDGSNVSGWSSVRSSGAPLGADALVVGGAGQEATEAGHVLAETTEHEVRPVGRPRRARSRDGPRIA